MRRNSIMEQIGKLKLFISYSHTDEKPYIEEFRKHITPLKNNGLIEDWYDRKILPGKDYQSEIDNNLEEADIICLFTSANFLSSSNCQKEKKRALELRKKKGTQVIPIILSPCAWQDDKDLSKSKLLALPTDGKPVSKFPDRNDAWVDVYNGLKNVIENEIKIRQLKIKKEFEEFLQDTMILTKVHSKKESVFLDDIFVYPDLDEYDDLREFKRKISSKELIENFQDYQKIVIAGEGQSGKTTLCKIIFKKLRALNFVPVYVIDKEHKFSGKIENRILRAFEQQYEGFNIKEIDRERIIPIIDDFHLAKNKEKHIEDLSKYSQCILTVDDIFALNIRDEKVISSFNYFKINEFKPSLRHDLIKKWLSISDKEKREIELYKYIDKYTEFIDYTLGKIFGKGIMPAYPFFILSAIVTYETFARPLNQEITSQGYCYQALTYFYLRKQGVRNEEIDIYINILTELAFYFYKEKKIELSIDEFNRFMYYYTSKFTLPIKKEIIFKNLSQVVSVDSFNNYSFRYPYLYYFFVGKYLAENIENSDIRKKVEDMMQNLHVDENAYIAVFLVHHTKNIKVLEEITLNALMLFDKYKPATLTKDEVKFFDEQADIIVEASLPPANVPPEEERSKRLKTIDRREQEQEKEKQVDVEDPLEKDLRRAIKTAEVIGCILKNRVGSLEKTKLKELFEEAMNTYLRILTSFFEIIGNKDAQKLIIDFISKALEKIIKEKKKRSSEEEMEKIARTIFWNLNFFFVYGLINKIAHSLGSDLLKEIVENLHNKINTPASFLVKQRIWMWYLKNLKIDEIIKRTKQEDFSNIAETVMKFMIVDYCSLHPISYKDRQKIENKLGIQTRKFLIKGYKGS